MSRTSQSTTEFIQPSLTEQDVQPVLSKKFGLKGKILPLDGEWDQNFHLSTSQQSFVVKISPASRDQAFYELQHALLSHIGNVDPSLRVPQPELCIDGETEARFRVQGEDYFVRVFTYLPGKSLRRVDKTPELLEKLGQFMGRLAKALQSFGHPTAHRKGYLWSLDNAEQCLPWIEYVDTEKHRDMLQRVFQRWESRVKPVLSELPAAVVHHDANDDNVLVDVADGNMHFGLIDFGDTVFSRRINELAVAMAYALMDVDNVMAAARAVIRGYAREFTLSETEWKVLFDLIAMRLAMSLCISYKRKVQRPDNQYLQVSQKQALHLLERLQAINPEFAVAAVRRSAGLDAVPQHKKVIEWLASHKGEFESVLAFDLKTEARLTLSLKKDAKGSEYAHDPKHYQQWLEQYMASAGARYAIGLYGEDRDCYSTAQFRSLYGDEPRSVHLGIDLFVPTDTPIQAPMAGRVFSVQDNTDPLDYGPTVIIEHRGDNNGPAFWTLFGHLSKRTLQLHQVGQQVAAGEVIGYVGSDDVNGGWAPHVHFQLMTDMLGLSGNFNGAGEPSNMDVWGQICPDPNLILNLSPESYELQEPLDLQSRRAKSLGPSLSLSYKKPLQIVRGQGIWLYDHTGRAYLDCVNNICHVGHCHPKVVEALSVQATELNTNTRYLHRNILDYAERLLATFPDPLEVCFFVCSGSEANELALRMARTYTSRLNTIVLNWAYHGNTQGLVDISPYKFNRKGGRGKPEHIHIAELPDAFRGSYKGYSKQTASDYAASVGDCIDQCIEQTGSGPAAFIAESMPGCAGQIVFPETYLQQAYRLVREAGGVCIADEVQTGFGRVGESIWAFDMQDVVPDIVTLGKPMGNGHPIAAVITTREIADSFANGMEYFNSFGGNPVSCAVGMAVLDVIEQEELQQNAKNISDYLFTKLNDLASKHELIGDVRGRGLFIGVELVADRLSLEPATQAASDVVNYLRDEGVLLSTDGPDDNVLKFKPPMVFNRNHADLLVDKLGQALSVVRTQGE